MRCRALRHTGGMKRSEAQPDGPAAAARPGPAGRQQVADWLLARGCQPFDFQRAVWKAMAEGCSGLLHADTGSGKTWAVALGALAAQLDALADGAGGQTSGAGVLHDRPRSPADPATGCEPGRRRGPRLLWITPMRALAADILHALSAPLADLAPGWRVALRTGDTPAAERARQDRRPPEWLVTTPESLTLLLARADAPAALSSVHTVVCDEWHELLASKRGAQLQLALARLAQWNPALRIWGLSATLGNPGHALDVLTWPVRGLAPQPPRLIEARGGRPIVIDTLLPPDPGRYTWAGHLGARMRDAVVAEIEATAGTTLVFTNVRSQVEAWYQMLLEARPDWAGRLALHHGSLDRAQRDWVEQGLKAGTLRAVVATSSLDLGVDFPPVERVLQIGSARGVARLLQRAGRSGHAPGRTSRVTLVPTNTLELVEAAAARAAVQAGRIESRTSPGQPLDLLVQHLVTVALGGGFDADQLYAEVRRAWAWRALARSDFDWALAFCAGGGHSLAAYPEYRRIARGADGLWRVPDARVARRHRMAIGTIVSDGALQVRWLGGGVLGTVEEGFIARLQPGDRFYFGGRLLELVRLREMTAWVRRASGGGGRVPVWAGGRMALSGELAGAVRDLLHRAALGPWDAPELAVPEMQAARPMLEEQARRSHLPAPGTLLIETLRSREGWHLFMHPFAGRSAHLGLASLLAWRLARGQANTFSIAVNDHGFELLAAQPFDLSPVRDGTLLSLRGLRADVLAALNATGLAQRRFREIARIAGLVAGGHPGTGPGARQLQASSGLFWAVFSRHDPDNRLLAQARREALAEELQLPRLAALLRSLRRCRIVHADLRQPSPLALPLMVERLRERLSTEQLAARLARMLARMVR